MGASARAEIDDPVSQSHEVEVVFDHDDCVALVSQLEKQVRKFLDIRPVQSGRGLI